jgi:hypothetical protein
VILTLVILVGIPLGIGVLAALGLILRSATAPALDPGRSILRAPTAWVAAELRARRRLSSLCSVPWANAAAQQVNVLVGPDSLVPYPEQQEAPVAQLGRNADGEVLEPGRVPDCYLGLLLDPTDHDTEAAGVLVVTPAALLHPQVPQPDGTVLYELVTGHPDRTSHELVFLTDLAVELRAWPYGTWARLGVDPQAGPPARSSPPGWTATSRACGSVDSPATRPWR